MVGQTGTEMDLRTLKNNNTAQILLKPTLMEMAYPMDGKSLTAWILPMVGMGTEIRMVTD
jgi:hypothetical protein